jgi:hypothetical protein
LSALPGIDDSCEFKIRGTAVAVDDAGAQRRYANAAIEAQHVTRWPAGVEYVRPNASATSLGAAEPVRDLLD